ncbi:hypothetical protein SAMN05444851_2600 [Aliiroseovarius sediminilitoris]|uniref:Uncharacterized protein n=1 Tax=Aliiroseovarius sediminilitoris TaxID=1173584 RepID=A0A1I0QJT2_9RHOB|nr:hypothetical protein SAMN05444851_2600 [Aliiroseovarius sediminilitoris]
MSICGSLGRTIPVMTGQDMSAIDTTAGGEVHTR